MDNTLIKMLVNALVASVIGYLSNNLGLGLFAYFVFVQFDRLHDEIKLKD